MSFSALDSALTGPLFATAEMRAVFSDRARIGAMLRVEAALARAEARFDLAPEGLAAAIEAIAPASLDLEKLGAETAARRRAGDPVRRRPSRHGCRRTLSRRSTRARRRRTCSTARSCSRCATRSPSSRPTFAPRIPAACSARPRASGDALRRAHLWPACRADHLRLQGRGVADRPRRRRRAAARACGLACSWRRSAGRWAPSPASARKGRRWPAPSPRISA